MGKSAEDTILLAGTAAEPINIEDASDEEIVGTCSALLSLAETIQEIISIRTKLNVQVKPMQQAKEYRQEKLPGASGNIKKKAPKVPARDLVPHSQLTLFDL